VDVRFRVTPDDRALSFHLRVRLPYSDINALGKALLAAIVDVIRRGD
jgi:hypothetical protein